MIPVEMEIDGVVFDLYEEFNFIYVKADKIFEAPAKKRDVTEYAEQAGENIDSRTVQAAFDYTITFAVVTPYSNLSNANDKIDAFNKRLYTQKAGSDVRTYKKVKLFDFYSGIMIVGSPNPIEKASSFYRRLNGAFEDCVEVEFKIRVSNPSLCNFKLKK